MHQAGTRSIYFRWMLVLSAVVFALGGVRLALAYAEEPLHFIDPHTGEQSSQEINTIHFDLTYALALAAGFSPGDSKSLQVWDQLVDSEKLGGTISYTNCTGSFYPVPLSTTVCASPGSLTKQIWPDGNNYTASDGCTTSRFGPYSPFFHFPRLNDQEIGALHDWGWGITDNLKGYEAYAWGKPAQFTVATASCTYTRTAVIQTGIPAGSLAAFATYIHSLGDAYSHRQCIQAIDAGQIDAPWGTHTIVPSDSDPCWYIPSSPKNIDAHGREYGAQWITDSNRTVEGILAIYAQLQERSFRREGVSVPLGLDDPLTGVTGATTLREAIDYFVHHWAFEPSDDSTPQSTYAQARRDYAAEIAAAIQTSQRTPLQRVFVPLVLP